VLLYEISKPRPAPAEKKTRKEMKPASSQDVDLLLKYLGRAADAGNYDLHKKPLLEAAVKKLLAKGAPTEKDAMLLVSLFRKCLLAMERSRG
jgi:tRNA C32,U32 (ribose-2'-O)-methylase TrmJ